MVVEPSPAGSGPLSAELSNVASACLLSLVVALGDTGKMLGALAAMLTTPPELSDITVQVSVCVCVYVCTCEGGREEGKDGIYNVTNLPCTIYVHVYTCYLNLDRSHLTPANA